MGFLSSLRRDIKGGTKAYKSFIGQRNKWVEQQLAASGMDIPNVTTADYGEGDRQQTIELTPAQQAALKAVPGGAGWSTGGDSEGWAINPAYQNLQRQFEQEQWNKIAVAEQKSKELGAQWLDTLDPATQTKALNEFKLHSSDMDSINKYGSMATKGLLAVIAGGAALTAGGVLGGTGAAGGGISAADAAAALGGAGEVAGGGTAVAGGGIGAAEAGLGYGGYSGAGGTVAGQGGLLGGTSIASGASPLGGLGVDIASGIGSAGSALGSTGSALGSTGSGTSMLDDLIGKVGSMSLADWLKAGSGSAAMYNMIKGMTTGDPDVPDFKELAEQDAAAKAKAQAEALRASRPDQTNAYGDTRKWVQDANGNWSQQDTFGAANQGLYDSAAALKGGLLEQARNTKPLTTEGLPDLGGIVMDPVGNNDAITQAWLARMRPELDRGREAEMQRLANMGVTENRYGGANQAFSNAQDTLNRKDVDATNQALIYGTDAYNKSFANSIQADQANRGNYQTEFNANKDVANNPYYQLNQAAGAIPGSPTFAPPGSVNASDTPDLSGAAGTDYKAQLDAMNAKLAQYEQNAKGLWDVFKMAGK